MRFEEWIKLLDEVEIGPGFDLNAFTRALEMRIVKRAIAASKTVAGAARLLGLKRTTIIYRYQLKRDDFEVKKF